MRDYSKIGPKFWIGDTGKKLRAAGQDAQVVAMYLLTSPHANMLGLYYLPISFMAHETGMSIEGASKGLERCIEAGFCLYDHASEVVWVLEMAKYQIGEALKPSDLRCKGVQNEYDQVPNNPFLSMYFERYGTAFCMTRPRGMPSPIKAPSKPHRSQEQEQEQEQEQDQEHLRGESSISRGPTPPPPAPLPVPAPSPAAVVCIALKAEGIGEVNPQHPDLQELIRQQVGVDVFIEAARYAKKHDKATFAYVLGRVRGQRADAQAAAEKARATPAAPPPATAKQQAQREQLHQWAPGLVAGKRNDPNTIDVEATHVRAIEP